MVCLLLNVLVPYKITLLSNQLLIGGIKDLVLVPYKITLLSNGMSQSVLFSAVLVPYKITLLSNALRIKSPFQKF